MRLQAEREQLVPQLEPQDAASHRQQDRAFSTEYAYATTNTQGGFSAGEIKQKLPNTFKEIMGLPQAAG